MTVVTKRICLLCFVVAVFALPKYAYSGEMTFSSALSTLYKVNESIAAAGETVQRHEMEVKAAKGLYFPTVSLNAGYLRFNDDLQMEVDLSPVKTSLAPLGQISPEIAYGLQGFPSSMNQVIQKEDMFVFGASALWPLFSGGKISAVNKAANIRAEMAHNARYSLQLKLSSRLAELYFGTRLYKDVAEVKKEAFDTMTDHYNKAIKMEKAGVLAKVERMHAEVALAEAKRSYEQALRDCELSKAALKSMLNSDDDIIPSTPLFIIPAYSIEPLSYFQEQALSNNGDIKQLEGGLKLTDTSVTSSYSSFLPSVFLFGGADIYSHNKTSLAPDWTAGIGMTYVIFEGFGGYNKTRAAKSAQRAVQLSKIRAEKDIKTLIEQQYITIENARADYESIQSSIAFTEEYLRARKKAFDQGMATSLDVVDAELALSAAKIAAIGAAYKFDVAMAKLLETSGLFGSFEDYRLKATVELGL